MLIECIVVEALDKASGTSGKVEYSRQPLASDKYSTCKRYHIVTESDVSWLAAPGEADSNQWQIKGLFIDKRIATHRSPAIDQTYHCWQYLWVASWQSIGSLRKDVN